VGTAFATAAGLAGTVAIVASATASPFFMLTAQPTLLMVKIKSSQEEVT
jgi:hypothetical protein